MEIMLVVPSLGVGGLEKFTLEAAECLRTTHSVRIVYFYHVENQPNTDIPTVCLNVPYGTNLISSIMAMLRRNHRVRKLKKEICPDLSFGIGKVASYSNELSKCREKTFSSLHGFTDIPQSGVSKFLDRMVFGRTDLLLCVSHGLKVEYIKRLRLAKNKVDVLYNPISTEDIYQKAQCEVVMPGAPVLFAYGRIVREKNFQLCLHALHRILQDYPQAMLYIAGEGPYLSDLQQLTTQLGIEKSVVYLGIQENPFQYLSKADICLNASWNEGFGRTIAEALACAVPIVASDCKVGIREILAPDTDLLKECSLIEYGKYGVLIPPSYPEDKEDVVIRKAGQMALAIKQLLINPDLLAQYKVYGPERAKDFAVNVFYRKLEELLED